MCNHPNMISTARRDFCPNCKFGGKKNKIAEWIMIMEMCLGKARTQWQLGYNNESILSEIRQATAVGVAAMEEHGAVSRTPDE